MIGRIFLLLGMVSCLTLVCCADNGDSGEGEDSNPLGIPAESSGTSGAETSGSSQPVTADSGLGQPNADAFFCGNTECTALEDDAGLGRVSALHFAFEYCCTPSNQCSTRQISDTDCPDPIVCGGEVCSSVSDTLATGGKACCSPSGQCSLTMTGPDGTTTCPDLINLDPDCPDVDGWAKHFEKDGNFVDPGAGVSDFDISLFTGGGCCLPDNTCGLEVLNMCMGPVYSFVGLNGPIIDCDGKILSSTDGGI